MGDGVNIAARLEGIALEPRRHCLSNAAYEQVRDKVSELVYSISATPKKRS